MKQTAYSNALHKLTNIIDDQAAYISQLEGILDANNIKYDKESDLPSDSSQNGTGEVAINPTVATVKKLYKGYNKVTKTYDYYPAYSPVSKDIVEKTVVYCTAYQDAKNTNVRIAIGDVLVNDDNEIAVVLADREGTHLTSYLMSYPSGNRLLVLSIDQWDADVQNLIDRKGWVVFTTIQENPSYDMLKDSNKDEDDD